MGTPDTLRFFDPKPEKVLQTDHPDFVGGIVWSKLEIEWIERRDARWNRLVGQLEARIQEIEKNLSDKIMERRRYERVSSDMFKQLQDNLDVLANAHNRRIEIAEKYELEPPREVTSEEHAVLMAATKKSGKVVHSGTFSPNLFCNRQLQEEGKPYPRTCRVCQLGPCKNEAGPFEL